jgi:hypothetical protein
MASNSESREPDDLRARNRTILLVIVVVAILGTIGLGLLAAWGAFTLSPDDQPPPSPTVAGMPAGETFAYLVEVGSDSVTIDPARMLTGEQARAAAAEDGVIGPNEDLPNDFYIVNPDPGPTSVDVDPEATVTVLEIPIGLSDLAAAFRGEDPGMEIYGLVPGEFPVTVVIENGTVQSIEQTYLP